MSLKHNAHNERVKRIYAEYLRRVKHYSPSTVDGVLKSIRRFEVHTHYKDFHQFKRGQAMSFSDALPSTQNARGSGNLSPATVYSILVHLKTFFVWLAARPGYKSRLSYEDAEYFSMTDKDARAAKSPGIQRQPTLAQIKRVVTSIKLVTEQDRRDQALIAFAILTGARDGALRSIRLKHVDLAQRLLFQNPREVATKNSKTIFTYFLNVGEPFEQIVVDWIRWLQVEKLWGMDDPLFPATKIQAVQCQGFAAAGLDRRAWTTASPIRDIFKRRFAEAGLPYYNPHSFRRTLVLFGERVCKTPEQFKAWSQNLGHEHVATTFNSYGNIGMARQGEVLQQLSPPEDR